MTKGFVTRNVVDLLENPRRPQKLPYVLSAKQINTMIDSVNRDVSSWVTRDKAILELLYGCGFTTSELLRADVNDIKWAEAIDHHPRRSWSRAESANGGCRSQKSLRLYVSERAKKLKAKSSHWKCATFALFVSTSLRGMAKVGKVPPLSRKSLDRIVKQIAIYCGLSSKGLTLHTSNLFRSTHVRKRCRPFRDRVPHGAQE